MKLSEIEAVGYLLTAYDEDRHALYTAEQMQEYAKECVREAIILNSGGAVSDDMIKRAIDSVFTEDTKND
ncbi:hypothetical protein [Lactococcus sp. KTH0-1S]|uniref:hypothetical protein n=1 Tax=Lactococcus sp. KTH0-1S TaxID=3438232 RepID=UPI00403C920A